MQWRELYPSRILLPLRVLNIVRDLKGATSLSILITFDSPKNLLLQSRVVPSLLCLFHKSKPKELNAINPSFNICGIFEVLALSLKLCSELSMALKILER